jgi:hypothetical protein
MTRLPMKIRNRLPSSMNLWHFGLLIGMFVVLYFLIALSMQRSDGPPVVSLTPESTVDLASAF